MKKDSEIIELILNGAQDHYEIIMEKYHNELFKYIYNLTNNYETTEDLLQEIYLKVYYKLDKYDKNKAKFRTWIYRIALNYTLTYLKSKNYREHSSVNLTNDYLIESDSNIEDDLIREEKITSIVNIIRNKFKPKQQKVMFLHFFSGLSVNEISEVTGYPTKTIYYTITSSIEKIKMEVSFNE